MRYGLPPDDALVARAVKFLKDGNENLASSLLLDCGVELGAYDTARGNLDYVRLGVAVTLKCNRTIYDVLMAGGSTMLAAIEYAFNAVIPQAYELEIGVLWDAEGAEAVSNQGTLAQTITRIWNNLKFRSRSEQAIAEALERAGVLFFPNCAARVGPSSHRRNREPDFLVCQDGKWGVLEVDGEPSHPAERAAFEHAQDRLFKQHGLLVVEHYDANACRANPDEVVQEFLTVLRQR